ncbi:MAG: tRNA 2-thiouridine(34) synthase MnmA [Nitrospira sp.]
MNKKPKVYVGVSGGVDSSVSLALLQKEGYDVTGVFLKVWNPDWLPCNWKEERRSAMRVCATLGVPFKTMDCEEEYKKEVVDYMIREYKEGRVPNPDIFCNKYVKFGVFLKKALSDGADFIATGHYAQIRIMNNESRIKNGKDDINNSKFIIHESVDKEKDQSYFLYTLGQHELSHTLFPIGGMTKPEVRKLAEKFGLPTATKKDSQGLCFIGKVDMKDFLSHYIDEKVGDVLNTNGEVVGTHTGSMFYTIGQRHGFTITKKSAEDPRFFVISKNLEKNTITVASKESELEKVKNIKSITIKNLHFVSGSEISLPAKISVRIRYRQEKQTCLLNKKDGDYVIDFTDSQSAVPVGQSAVLYDGDVCLGGGIIETVN